MFSANPVIRSLGAIVCAPLQLAALLGKFLLFGLFVFALCLTGTSRRS